MSQDPTPTEPSPEALEWAEEVAAERNRIDGLEARAERAESRAKELEADLAAAQERIKTLGEALRQK